MSNPNTRSKQAAALLVFAVLHGYACAEYEEPLCISPNNVFHARIDLHAGALGYYIFEECGLTVMNPTIAMEVGETYTFIQKDRTNYFHRK